MLLDLIASGLRNPGAEHGPVPMHGNNIVRACFLVILARRVHLMLLVERSHESDALGVLGYRITG